MEAGRDVETFEEEEEGKRACVRARAWEGGQKEMWPLVGMIYSGRNEHIDKSSVCAMGCVECLPSYWFVSVRAFPLFLFIHLFILFCLHVLPRQEVQL